MRWCSLAVLGICVLAPGPAAAQEPVTPAGLEGAWKLQSLSYDGQPQEAVGYLVFHGQYYSWVTTRKRPNLTAEISRKPAQELTDADKLLIIEAYNSMTAAAGTYTIDKGAIAFMREAVRSPHLKGSAEVRASWFEKGKLIQDFEGGGRRQVYVWERVSGPGAAPKRTAADKP